MTTFFVLLEKMKFAVDEGEWRAPLPPADGGGESRLKCLAWPSLEDMAAVFRRIASWRRMDEAGMLTGGTFRVGETLGETVWGFGRVTSNCDCDEVVLGLSSDSLGSLWVSFSLVLAFMPSVAG